MKEWAYRFALPLILVALVPSLIGIWHNQDQIAQNKRTLNHLCSIDRVNQEIYEQAVLGYRSLGNKATPDQKRLIKVLVRAAMDIQKDKSCPKEE